MLPAGFTEKKECTVLQILLMRGNKCQRMGSVQTSEKSIVFLLVGFSSGGGTKYAKIYIA
jgi:hypothetical protein